MAKTFLVKRLKFIRKKAKCLYAALEFTYYLTQLSKSAQNLELLEFLFGISTY